MAKLDPRADPVSDAPSAPSAKDDFSVDRVVVPKDTHAKKTEPDAASSGSGLELESSVVAVDKSADRGADAEPAVERTATKITSRDPRYEPLEKLLDLNDWKKIAADLGPMDEVGKLPPNLGLLAALAHNEVAKEGNPDAAAAAIRCMAGLLGVDAESPIARVLARRMLRKNPVKLSERQAPPARTSLLIVLVTLVLGGGVGFVASAGSWNAIAHMLHLR